MAEETTLDEVLKVPPAYTAAGVTFQPRKLLLADAAGAFAAYIGALGVLAQALGRAPTEEDAGETLGCLLADLYATDPESQADVLKLFAAVSDATEETLGKLQTVEEFAGLWAAGYQANRRPFGLRLSRFRPLANALLTTETASLLPDSSPEELTPEIAD